MFININYIIPYYDLWKVEKQRKIINCIHQVQNKIAFHWYD